MREDLVEVVERLTGRKVRVFLSQGHHDPEVAAELFLLEPELEKPDDNPLNRDGHEPVLT